MSTFLKTALATVATLPLLASGASAQMLCTWLGGCRPTTVPEIDASTGLLALAAVAAGLAFVWERRRRAKAAN